MDNLPPALLNKLITEAEDVARTAATSDLRTTTSAARSYAQRRLMAGTDAQLTVLENLAVSADPKTRLGAVSKLVDLNPATRVDPSPTAQTTDSIPAAAIAAIFDGLKPFVEAIAGLAPNAASAAPTTTVEATIVEPIAVLVPKRKRGRPPREDKPNAVHKRRKAKPNA